MTLTHAVLRRCPQAVAEHLGERVLVTPRNPISVAMTLDVMQASRR